MEFSIAYFAADMAHLLAAARDDLHFIAHHAVTLAYIISCRYYTGHGAMSVVALVFLGEVTNPLQNVWTIAKMASARGSTGARALYEALTLPFVVIYTLVRLVACPIGVWTLQSFYMSGKADAVIPHWLSACWMAMSWLAIAGSAAWVARLWPDVLRRHPPKIQKTL
eukprot:SM000052S17708  [mRNA]  locus=s52:255312:255951:+ [translate_table: standard]